MRSVECPTTDTEGNRDSDPARGAVDNLHRVCFVIDGCTCGVVGRITHAGFRGERRNLAAVIVHNSELEWRERRRRYGEKEAAPLAGPFGFRCTEADPYGDGTSITSARPHGSPPCRSAQRRRSHHRRRIPPRVAGDRCDPHRVSLARAPPSTAVCRLAGAVQTTFALVAFAHVPRWNGS